MKKLLLLAFLNLAFFSYTQAQRAAIIDIDGILKDLPDFIKAQDEIDKIAAKWQQDIAQEYDKIKSMYNKYQAEQVLLSEEVRLEREEEIMEKEQQVRELQKRRFGPEGDLFRRRQELVSPIQDEVYTVIEEYAKLKGYDLIFDKTGAAGLIYANEEYDKTNEIRRELGIKSK